ncbi:MAG TPA: response regulator [Pyrinomonadaceae bacterium]|nr:response regulator [Pyrinomonadaceae bacterium]
MPHTVLYAEDHQVVADAVKQTLEAEGLRVVMCADGAVALRKISSSTHYDLFIVDNHLPNVNGLELVGYIRHLPHRKTIPIIMLSASDAQKEAYQAGVDVYLKKPEDVGVLVRFVNQLIR